MTSTDDLRLAAKDAQRRDREHRETHAWRGYCASVTAPEVWRMIARVLRADVAASASDAERDALASLIAERALAEHGRRTPDGEWRIPAGAVTRRSIRADALDVLRRRGGAAYLSIADVADADAERLDAGADDGADAGADDADAPLLDRALRASLRASADPERSPDFSAPDLAAALAPILARMLAPSRAGRSVSARECERAALAAILGASTHAADHLGVSAGSVRKAAGRVREGAASLPRESVVAAVRLAADALDREAMADAPGGTPRVALTSAERDALAAVGTALDAERGSMAPSAVAARTADAERVDRATRSAAIARRLFGGSAADRERERERRAYYRDGATIARRVARRDAERRRADFLRDAAYAVGVAADGHVSRR